MWRVVLLLVTGCSLYFGPAHSSSADAGRDGEGVPDASELDAEADPNSIARPCIRAVAAGSFNFGGADDIFLTYVCDANGAAAIIEYDDYAGGVLTPGTAHADFQQPFISARIVDADGQLPTDVLTMDQYTPGGWVFAGGTWFSYASARAFTDAYMGDLDGVAPNDLIFAGDGAIRVQHGMFATTETELLSGKSFRNVAVAPLGSSQSDFFYIAGDAGQPLELGTALQTSANPLTYTIGSTVADPAAPALPLVVADVDGDHVPDVIGGTSHVFVRSSKTGVLTFLEEKPSALAAGDLDGDGVSDIVYITADHSSIREVVVGANGQLTSTPLLAAGGDQVVIADVDGDHRGDLVVIRGVGTPGSLLTVYRSPL